MQNICIRAVKAAGAVVGLAACSGIALAATLTGVDVGAPGNPGSLTVNGDKMTIVGGGDDIWNTSDNFFYAYMPVTGDFDYVMKVESLVGNSGDGGWSKVELMARLEDPDLASGPQGNDPHISNMVNRPSSDTANGAPAGVNNRGPQWRAHRATDINPDPNGVAYNGASSWTAPNPAYPPQPPDQWVRLERVGSVFYMYTSNDGTTWNMYNPYNPQGWDTAGSWPAGADSADQSIFTNAWPSKVFLGIAVTAHNNGDVSTAVVSGFKPWTPVPIAITTQPPATVSISANSKLELSVAATGDPVHYQWRKDGTAIPRAVGPTYSVTLAQTSDSGTYTVRVFGGGQEIISSASVVTVTPDTTPPTITEAKPLSSQTSLQVTFSEPVTAATANVAANYQISGGVSVTSAALSADGYSVTMVTSQQTLNTQYTLTVNNVKDTAGNSIAANTTATFTSVSLLTGYAFYERWNDASGDLGDLTAFAQAIADDQAGTTPIRSPDVTAVVSQFGGPWGVADNYNARVSTFFIPPSSGNYIFFVSSDDSSNVYLSTDENPANKKLICQEVGWSNQYQWTAPGSGDAANKRSDQNPNVEWPGYYPITLVGGKKYYMEALQNEGGGGDGVDVTFIKEGDADPSNDANGMFMKGNVISWYETVDVLPPVIVTHPVDNLTIPAGGTATLSVVATNPGSASLTYQWQRNGRDIPGATSADYTISNASPLDIGQYWVKVSNPKASVTSGQGTPNPTVVLVTASDVYNIEAEDFDNNGQPQAAASDMPYKGNAYTNLTAVFDVDYHNTDALDSTVYRQGLNAGENADTSDNQGGQWGLTRAGEWEMTYNFKIGWIGTGDWGNYTRTFPTPAKTYYVFAAQSYDGVNAGQLNSSLGFVTAGVGTTTQTVDPVGTFDAPGSGDWSRNNLVAMTDSAGNIKTVEVGGTKTVRWTYNSGDADYLLFIPVGGGGGTPTVSIAKDAAGLKVTYTGTLQSADLVTGPFADVTGATSPYSVTPAGAMKYFRTRQ